MFSNNNKSTDDGVTDSLLSPSPPAFTDPYRAPSAGDDDLLTFPQVPSGGPTQAPLYSVADDELLQYKQSHGYADGKSASTGPPGSLLDDDLLQLDDAVAISSKQGRTEYAEVDGYAGGSANNVADPVYAEIGPATAGLSLMPGNFSIGPGGGIGTIPAQALPCPTARVTDGADASQYLEVGSASAAPASSLYLEVDGTSIGNGADVPPATPAGGQQNYLEVDRTPTSAHATAAQPPGADTASAGQFSRPVTFVGGQLPDDFLTLMVPTEVPIVPPGQDELFPDSGVLTVFLDQARLAKNYGIGRMDPYVRLSVGQDRQCSQVCVNGAKTPFWNSSVSINLPDIADFSLKVEVLSQGTFSDRLVGWTEIPILEAYQGRRIEAWHHLTGKQGKDKEGVINLAVSFQRTEFLYQPVPGIPNGYSLHPVPPGQRGGVHPRQVQSRYGMYQPPGQHMPVPTGYAGQPAYSMPPPQYPPGPQYPPHSVPPHMQHQQPPQQQRHPPVAPQQQQQYGHPAAYQSQPYGAGPPQPQPQMPSAAAQSNPEPLRRSNPGEVQQLKDMFPTFDNAIIESVLEGTQGDVGQAIESLLSMS